MRFDWDEEKSRKLKKERGISFEEALEIFRSEWKATTTNDVPPKDVAIGWVKAQLITLIHETRLDDEGEYFHLVTLWKTTKQEKKYHGIIKK